MTYNWYKIINRAEFEAEGIPSREVTLILDELGLKTVMVTKGNFYSLIYEGVMLSVSMNGENPFAFGGYAAYLDANDDLWLGIENA